MLELMMAKILEIGDNPGKVLVKEGESDRLLDLLIESGNVEIVGEGSSELALYLTEQGTQYYNTVRNLPVFYVEQD